MEAGKKEFKTFADLQKVVDQKKSKQLSTDALEKTASRTDNLSNNERINSILTNKIDPDPNQPRKFFNKTTLVDLTNSIRARGVDTPIIVRPSGDGRYKIVAGERRFRCSVAIGLKSIPAVIKDYSDAQSYIAALTENIQREDLHYLDESEAFKCMIDQGYVKDQGELAETLGKSNAYISSKLKILSLPQKLKDLIFTSDQITFTHAMLLQQIRNDNISLDMAKKIIAGELSTRKLEALISSGVLEKVNLPRPKSSFQPVQMKARSNGFDMTIKYRKDRPEDIMKIINVFEQKIVELKTQVKSD